MQRYCVRHGPMLRPSRISRHDRNQLSSRTYLRQTSNSTPNGIKPTNTSTRIDRIISRTPRSLQRHIQTIRSAPVTHMTAFLILHELTAIIPLFLLAGAFHYYDWLPKFFSEGEWVRSGIEKFGRYFRRKGWVVDEEQVEREEKVMGMQEEKMGVDRVEEDSLAANRASKDMWFGRVSGEEGTRIVVEFATAYAIIKALMPLRLLLSAWGAPWFARWTVIPVGSAFRKVFGKSKSLSITNNGVK